MKTLCAVQVRSSTAVEGAPSDHRTVAALAFLSYDILLTFADEVSLHRLLYARDTAWTRTLELDGIETS